MTQRHVHYEAAFEDFVRSRGWPYVPIDERKKAIFAGARIKSFDFLVYPPGRRGWIADVKGRKFPYEVNGTRRYWENWVTVEDLDGLARWQSVFGEGFEAVLVFAYWLIDPRRDLPDTALHWFRQESYAFLWVPAGVYGANARRRSTRWDTMSMSQRRFRSLARPMEPVVAGETADGPADFTPRLPVV
jgi:hypothetical protein